MVTKIWEGYIRNILSDSEFVSTIKTCLRLECNTKGHETERILFEHIVMFFRGLLGFSQLLCNEVKLIKVSDYKSILVSLQRPSDGGMAVTNGKLWPFRYLFGLRLFVSPHECLALCLVSRQILCVFQAQTDERTFV